MSHNATSSYDSVAHSFVIERLHGERTGSPYTPESGRAIFWVRKL
ncbi:MAG TPA: hypothetical protein VMX94_03280 [Armatimonadota bacterium]|nr:hypothetical protein [Armatimonadota bacterium]